MRPIGESERVTVEIQMIERRPQPHRIAILVEVYDKIAGNGYRRRLSCQSTLTDTLRYDHDDVPVGKQGEIVVHTGDIVPLASRAACGRERRAQLGACECRDHIPR